MRRLFGILLVCCAAAQVLVGLAGAGGASAASATSHTSSSCVHRLLVLSAMPLELDPLLAHAKVESRPVVVNHRPFVDAELGGNHVIMGLTGIGPENAQAATDAAFARFLCSDGSPQISGVVFSGTSGGDYIGDVFVPSAWSDAGAPAVPVSSDMLTVAEQAPAPHLIQSTPLGDPACLCEATSGLLLPITVQHVPTVSFGGTGLTTDPFGGRTLPCVATGNDVFGCTPCREFDRDAADQLQALVGGAPAFLELSFFTGYAQSTAPAGDWVAEDDETAVVAQIAAQHSTPFIGFRAASDGAGDPLHLPGFPSEFFVYRQLAADNAAAAALGFLTQWSSDHPSQ